MTKKLTNLQTYLENKQEFTNFCLNEFLDKSTSQPKIIKKSMRYSVFNGGKRLRPTLAFLANDIVKKTNLRDFKVNFSKNIKSSNIESLSVALELIHCYSLVHDDLPALDNDDYRRGKLTCHKKFGEAIAILAGDALLTKAFESMSRISDANILKQVLSEIVKNIGENGMIGGQVVDLESEKLDPKNKNAAKILDYIHRNKTAKLIETSLAAGAIVGGGNAKVVEEFRKYGECLGYMFQITDDILDIVGNKKLLGKKGSDLENQKLTYVAIFGLEKSYKFVAKFKNKAKKILKNLELNFGLETDLLSELLDYVEKRSY